MFFEISSEIGVLQQILTWYCTVAQISFSANSCPRLWQGLIFDFANTFSADNATPSASYWRKVAQGRTPYTLTVELSTWLSRKYENFYYFDIMLLFFTVSILIQLYIYIYNCIKILTVKREVLYQSNKNFSYFREIREIRILRHSFKRQCPLRPSEIENMWHMMKNQNSPFFAHGSSRNVVAFFVEKLFLNLQKI